MKESALVTKIRKAVQAAYPSAYIVKLADRSRRGLPDLLIVFFHFIGTHGRDVLTETLLFVEVKTEDGKLAPIQKEEHRRIEKAGGTVLVATDADQVLLMMSGMRAIP